jgi:hypothetical protein
MKLKGEEKKNCAYVCGLQFLQAATTFFFFLLSRVMASEIVDKGRKQWK